jgi:hypothetical protein
MKHRFTTKDENIKPFVCLRHGQMSIKCIFVLNHLFKGTLNENRYILTGSHMKPPILELDYTASAIDIGILRSSVDDEAQQQEHLTANRHINERLDMPWLQSTH